ncbi:unnamed protein product [Rhizoctonia solani]|uniref:Laminin domain protein n=1 Tax=Rhizoctonia solani TaxID=456999 RepID=A0A8H2Y2P0_9AGAM|nr:unnamed protein product [Rhizoctonia solani]
MADRPGWYPPSQICSPPELPAYLKEVCDLKPIVGAPSDDEVVGIHSVIHAANQVSVVPAMNNPGLVMALADHLFSVQMARYGSKYSLITFPSDAIYTPPILPSHILANLEPVSGAPTDDEIMKVQDTVQTYQEMRRFPSMFDAHVNMELAQHLFDLHMARYMRLASEHPPSTSQDSPRVKISLPATEITGEATEGALFATNNIGTGANVTLVDYESQSTAPIDIRELLERSNQLAERFNQLLEHSNILVERSNQPADRTDLAERFDQVLELSTQHAKSHQPTEPTDRLAERLNGFFDKFNSMVEQSSQRVDQLAERSIQLLERSNQLLEEFTQSSQRSNELSEKANEAAERLNQLTDHSNKLMEKTNKPLEGTMKNINRVLVGIQHAIVRVGFSSLCCDQLKVYSLTES